MIGYLKNWATLRSIAAKRARKAGNNARDSKNWRAAIAAYDAYLALHPNDWRIRVQFGHALKEDGDLMGAEAAYRQSALLAPDDSDVMLQLGHVLKLSGRLAEASDAYKRSLLLDSDSPALRELELLISAQRPEDLELEFKDREAGDRARDNREWLEAARCYNSYLRTNPSDGPIWVQLGNVLKEANEFNDAERAYRAAIQLSPHSPEPFLQLGHLFKVSDRHDLAIEAYRQSEALGNNTDARMELESLGASQIDFPGPAVNSKENLKPKTVPTIPTPWKTLLAAQAARDQRNWNEAIDLYRHYISSADDSGQIWFELSYVLRLAGRNNEAYEAIRRAIEFSPQTSAWLTDKASLLLKLGRVDEYSKLRMDMIRKTGLDFGEKA